MAYKHGVYGEQTASGAGRSARAAGTIPAYIGTAPVWRANHAAEGGEELTMTPLLIRSFEDAKNKLGYSEDFASFPLCEAVSAHFLARGQAVGPIVAVNFADPAGTATANTTVEVPLDGEKTGIVTDIFADKNKITVSDGSTPLTAEELDLQYLDGGRIKIQIRKAGFSQSAVTVSYKKIDLSDQKLTASVFEAALGSLDLCELKTGVIPTILCAPGYGEKPAYHEKLMAKAADRISKKWYVRANVDLPADGSVNTPEAAAAWKQSNGYQGRLEKVFYPRAMLGGKLYHLSTLATAAMQALDTENGGIPYASASNSRIYAQALALQDGTQVLLDEPRANCLNERGITTANIVRGGYRLWGPHNANYSYEQANALSPEDLQDSSIAMMLYLLNYMQAQYLDLIDKPISRRDIDGVKASVQQWLNALVNEGKLLYAEIDFVSEDNTKEMYVSGDFVFHVKTTTTPNAKSVTFRLQYSQDGLEALENGGESA